jgi:DNA topoisomerase-1
MSRSFPVEGSTPTGEVRGEVTEIDPATPAATPRRATITDDIAPDEMTPAKARELLDAASDDGRVLGNDPLSGHEIVAKAGRYGPYVTEVIPDPL